MKRILCIILTAVLAVGMTEYAVIPARAAETVVSAPTVETPEQKEARLKAEKKKKEAVTKKLSYNKKNIKKIGKQMGRGGNLRRACAAFSLAYCRAILDGKAKGAHRFLAFSCYASWTKAKYKTKKYSSNKKLYKAMYNEIKKGKPVVVHLRYRGRSGEHWVAVMGYHNVKNVNKLSLSNFNIIDPVSAKEYKNGSKGYYRYAIHGDRRIAVSKK